MMKISLAEKRQSIHKMNQQSATVPFVCEVCQKNFKHKESLDKHKAVVHIHSEAVIGMNLSISDVLSELINECESVIKDPI